MRCIIEGESFIVYIMLRNKNKQVCKSTPAFLFYEKGSSTYVNEWRPFAYEAELVEVTFMVTTASCARIAVTPQP